MFGRIATGDIDVVPTEAEADDLISEADALAAEEARLQSEVEAAAQAEAEQLAAELAAANPDGVGDFEVLVPDGSDRAASPARLDEAPGESEESDRDDVLVLVPGPEGDGEP